jgi:hypothetical protein
LFTALICVPRFPDTLIRAEFKFEDALTMLPLRMPDVAVTPAFRLLDTLIKLVFRIPEVAVTVPLR